MLHNRRPAVTSSIASSHMRIVRYLKAGAMVKDVAAISMYLGGFR